MAPSRLARLEYHRDLLPIVIAHLKHAKQHGDPDRRFAIMVDQLTALRAELAELVEMFTPRPPPVSPDDERRRCPCGTVLCEIERAHQSVTVYVLSLDPDRYMPNEPMPYNRSFCDVCTARVMAFVRTIAAVN